MLKTKFNDSENYIYTSFSMSNGIVTLKGSDVPESEAGFRLYKSNGKVLGNYDDYKTVYRVLEDGVQFSNDGSKYIEPTYDVVVSIIWNTNKIRNIVTVEIEHEDKKDNINLTSDNNWSFTYSNIPVSISFSVTAPDFPGLEKSIDGTTITYSDPQSLPIDINALASQVEMNTIDIVETQIGLVDTYEAMEANTDSITICEEALAEIYEMIIG